MQQCVILHKYVRALPVPPLLVSVYINILGLLMLCLTAEKISMLDPFLDVQPSGSEH